MNGLVDPVMGYWYLQGGLGGFDSLPLAAIRGCFWRL